MATIFCEECGKEIFETAEKCPHCGYPVFSRPLGRRATPETPRPLNQKPTGQSRPASPIENAAPTAQSQSGMGLIALILSVLGCTCLVGTILAIIDLTRNDKSKKHALSVVALAASGLWFVTAIIFGVTLSNDSGGAIAELQDSIIFEDSRANLADTPEATEIIEEPAEKPTGEDASKETNRITIDEQVILDQDGYTITAKEITDGIFGSEINLLIENNSSGDITVQSRNMTVNGYMISSMLSADVVAGKKSNESLTLSGIDLEMSGIDAVASVKFNIAVLDADSWDELLFTDTIEIETSIVSDYAQVYDDSGEVLLDRDGIKIVSKGIGDESIFGPSVILYIENNSDQAVTVQVRDTSVNGFMITPTMSSEVLPGMRAVSNLTFFESELEENQITEIKDIETSFHVFDTDSWDTIFDSETIVITF